MRLRILDPTVDFSANALGLAGAPIDNSADQSLLFSGTGGVFGVTGVNVVNAAPYSGVTVAGSANYATLGSIGVLGYDTGIVLGANGFSFLAVMRVAAQSGAGCGLLSSNSGTTSAYGFFDVYSQPRFVYKPSASGAVNLAEPSTFQYGEWQVWGYDVSPAGVVTTYRGYNGALSVDQTVNAPAYYDTEQTLVLGLAASGTYAVDIAQINTYKGANRLTPANFSLQYRKLSLYYGSKLQNPV